MTVCVRNGSGRGAGHDNVDARKSVACLIVDSARPFTIGIIAVYPELTVSGLEIPDHGFILRACGFARLVEFENNGHFHLNSYRLTLLRSRMEAGSVLYHAHGCCVTACSDPFDSLYV